MQKMVKRIILTFSTIIVVLLLMPVFTTKSIASEVTDLEAEYPYIYWMPEDKTLALSKKPISLTTISSDNGIIITSFNNGARYETNTFKYTFLYVPNYVVGDAYRLIYNDITGWIAEYPDFIKRGLTQSGTFYSVFGRESTFVYYSNVAGNLPDGIPPLDDINNKINDALNATTNITEQANDVVQQMNSSTEQFERGEITVNQFQNIIQNNINITNELANNAGATLADQIAVNNAQNAIQIGQDALIGSQLNETVHKGLNGVENTVRDQMYNDNRLNRELLEELNRLILTGEYYQNNSDPSMIYDMLKQLILDPYLNGDITKDEALYNMEIIPEMGINGLIGLRNVVITEINSCKTIGDYEYFNQIIKMIDKVIDGINQAGDVNKDISDSFESSESEEIEYLEMIEREHDQNITEISPRWEIQDADKQSARNVISIIWDNRFVKSLMVVCGCFMCVCVVLGIKYKV